MGKINGDGDGRRKVAVYARVSTGKQDDSLDEQIRLIQEYCEHNNFEIYKVFSETASGAKEDRKEFNSLMHEVEMRTNSFDAIVVLKLDRFSRSLQSLVNSIEFLKDRKVDFISIRDNIETTTPAGKLMFHIFGALAEFERGLIRERTKIGIERAKREGILCNRPKKAIDIDKVIKLYNNGVILKDIAKVNNMSTVTLWKRLKEAGVVQDKKLHKMEIKDNYRYPAS